MRIAKTVSITLPPDLLAKAQELAQREHRTMSELFREALRRYMQGGDAAWECCEPVNTPAKDQQLDALACLLT